MTKMCKRKEVLLDCFLTSTNDFQHYKDVIIWTVKLFCNPGERMQRVGYLSRNFVINVQMLDSSLGRKYNL